MKITDYNLGCLGSAIDERDIYYSDVASASESITIPEFFELKYQFKPKQQGNVNSCVAHALSEYDEIIKHSNELFSVGFIYANRSSEDYQGTGMIVREALKHLVDEGNVLNKDFPTNEEYPNIINYLDKYGKDYLYKKALENRNKGYVRLTVDDIKKYMITENKPIIITIKVYENFLDIKRNNGYIPTNPSGKLLGGHCMTIVGYYKNKLKILNSDGNSGDNGYVYLDMDSPIIKELWALTDESLYKPPMPPKDITSPTNPVTPITPITQVLYRVQLGAFKNRKYADELMAELNKKDIDSCIKIYGDLFKIQVGVYKVKSNAYEMLNKMISLGYKDAFLVECK